MMDNTRANLHPRSKFTSSTPRSLHPVRSFQNAANPPLKIEKDPYPFAAFGLRKQHSKEVNALASSPAPLQPPIGQAPRFYNKNDGNSRMPYSAALLSTRMTLTASRNQSDQRGHTTESSSSLATQVEPSSSSVNGDQPVKKCGATDLTTSLSESLNAIDEGVTFFVANLPYVPINMPLDRVRADLYAHLSQSAKIDDVTIRFGRYARVNSPHGSRQVMAFVYIATAEEAKKAMSCRLPLFMGCQLRLEATHNQRTLIVNTNRERISLQPLQAAQPWSDNKQHYPLLYQKRDQDCPVLFNRMLVRELCSAFGPIVRLHTDRAPFEVLFTDFENCRRALKALAQTSAATGIVASLPHAHLPASRTTDPRSESEVEFSSDCLPITTTSSSILDLSLNLDDKERPPVTPTHSASGEEVAAPLSPLTESPPTPTLTNTHEHSDSETEHQESEQASRLPVPVRLSSKNNTEARRGNTPAKAGRELDPCGIFVSRLPTVDNLEDCLHSHFAQDGSIKYLRVLNSKSNSISKFAFITFHDENSAKKALSRNGQPLLGKLLNIRPRETGSLAYHRQGQSPKTSLTIIEDVAAVNEAISTSTTAEACASVGSVPSMTIRLGNGPTSPERRMGKTVKSTLPSSPSKQRGASLPSRPPQWSPSRESWTASSLPGNPSPVGPGGAPMREGAVYRPSYDQNCAGEIVYGMSLQPVTAAPWPQPPLSPVSVATQPNSAAQSPISPSKNFKLAPLTGSLDQMSNNGSPAKTPVNHRTNDSNDHQPAGATNWNPGHPLVDCQGGGGMMVFAAPPFVQGEFGLPPYWPVMTMDPSGQRYVVHPVGTCCTSMMSSGGPYPQSMPLQQTSSNQTDQGNTLSQQQHREKVNWAGGGHVVAPLYPDHHEEVASHQTHTGAHHFAGLTYGHSPHFYSHTPMGPQGLASNPSPWAMMHPVPFPEPHTSHFPEGEGQKQIKKAHHGQGETYQGNPCPIQIPAVSVVR